MVASPVNTTPAVQRIHSITMTLSSYAATVAHAIFAPFFNTDPDDFTYGADDVQAAIDEVSSITDRRFTATLGEPELKDFGGFFQPDWKVIISVTSSDYDDPGPLIFDLPRGNSDDEALFNVLMDNVGAVEISDIEGAEVPMEVVGGNPMVFWDAITQPSKGTEEDPFTEEDIEQALDESETEDDE